MDNVTKEYKFHKLTKANVGSKSFVGIVLAFKIMLVFPNKVSH